MPTYTKPVFIVGMPRSGTTLIQGILCNTGEFFPMPETHFFVRTTYGLPEENLNKKDRERIQHKLFKKSRIKLDQGLPEYLTTQKDIFEHVIDQFNPKGTRTFLEKTPRHVFFYSKILEYYPDAKFICMIREPKNVVSSQLKNSPKESKSVIRLSLLYKKIAEAILTIRNNNNVLLIKYEDLTAETEQILRHTYKFLNIAFDHRLVDNVAAPPGIVSEQEYWKKKNLDQNMIQKNKADKWQKVLSPGQANIVNFITKSLAEKFGYGFSFEWLPLCKGVVQDIRRLASSSEFKKVFLNTHG
jgi:hypothetical protein